MDESALQRFSWLVHEVNGRSVVGMPGVRDPEHPCEAFSPGKPGGTCLTDGHYLCDECAERKTCETGCGERPMHCTCKLCVLCLELGSDCSCATLPQEPRS